MSLVQLHVYDVAATHSTAIRNFNTIGREVGMGGIFHGGIEVNQQEWSYGYGPTGSGVYCCQPKQNPMYNYRESVTLGITHLSAQEVRMAIAKLRSEWMGHNYELLTNNCLHFCDALADRLKVPRIPAWLNRMAYGADAVCTFANNAYEQVRWLGNTTQSWWASYMGGSAQPQQKPDKELAAHASSQLPSSHAPSQLFHVPSQLEPLPSRQAT